MSAYFSLFQSVLTYSNLSQPIPAHYSMFQPIPAYYSLFQAITAYFSLFCIICIICIIRIICIVCMICIFYKIWIFCIICIICTIWIIRTICIISLLPRERWDNLSIFKGQSNIRTVASVSNKQTTNQPTTQILSLLDLSKWFFYLVKTGVWQYQKEGNAMFSFFLNI